MNNDLTDINTTNLESSSEYSKLNTNPQNMDSGTRIDVDFKQIPSMMKNRDRWVMWKRESRDGKTTKVPYETNERKAKTNDPTTWTSFDEVSVAFESGNFSGIGFCLGPDEEIGKNWLGFDVDKRRNPETRTWDDEKDLTFLLNFGSYAEISQSGTGGHAIGWGELKGDRRRKGSYEIYDGLNKNGDFAGRFFVVTGWKIEGSTADIRDANPDGIAAIESILSEGTSPLPSTSKATTTNTSNKCEPDRYVNPPSNDEIIRMIRKSKQGRKFGLLYDEGAWNRVSKSNGEGYQSLSEARYALISIIYWWTRSVISTHTIVCQSALARLDLDKWSRIGAAEVSKIATEFSERKVDDPPYMSRNCESNDRNINRSENDIGTLLPDPVTHPYQQIFECNDEGNGDRFLYQHRNDVRYCESFKKWLLWTGNRWEEDHSLRIQALAKLVARSIQHEVNYAIQTRDDRNSALFKWSSASCMLPRIKAMVDSAAPLVSIKPDDFDTHEYLMNCENGTIDLQKMEIREPRREDMLTKLAGVAYIKDATCPKWENHINLIFGEDKEYIDGFQEFCGYSLLQYNPEQILAVMYGTGANGKSVTMGVLSQIMGDYAVNIAAESLMVKKSDGPRSDLARLKGARLAWASEGEAGAELGESMIKTLTGDDLITVRRLYENEFSFKPGAKIILITNHEPRIKGTDHGIWRRIWLFPFTVRIPEEKRNPNIMKELMEEASGILNWCLSGLKRYQERGKLQPPKKVVAATDKYRSDQDIIGQFVEDWFVDEPSKTILKGAFYNMYKNWCESSGEKPVSNKVLARYMREKGYGEKKITGDRAWIGIRQRDSHEYT